MAVRGQRGVEIRRLVPLMLMPGAAFAVHQLRFWLAYGSRASAELQIQGHSYLHSVVPWAVAFLALWMGVFLRAMGRALGGRCSVARYTISFSALWLLCAASLVGIYACQEFLEGVFLTGHPGGLAGIFGYGGWWAVPAALAVGLVLAAIFHGTRWALHEVARRNGPAPAVALERASSTRLPRSVLLPHPAPLIAGRSGRGPPV